MRLKTSMLYLFQIWQIGAIFLLYLGTSNTARAEQVYVPTEVRISPFKSKNIFQTGRLPPFTITKQTSRTSPPKKREEPKVDLWILSQNHLWRWTLDSNLLSKISITGFESSPETAEDSLITSSGQSLYFYQNATLFIYRMPEKKLFKMAFPKETYGIVKGIFPGGRYLWVITEKGTLQYDPQDMRLTPQKRLDLSDFRGRGIINQSLSLLYPVKNKILSVALQKDPTDAKKPEKTVFFQTTEPILGIDRIEQEIYIHTAYSIIRLDPTGKLLQAIPVEQRRKLHRLSFEESDERGHIYHSYQFHDGLVEVYNISRKQVVRYALPAPQKKPSSPFLIATPYLVVGDDGILRVFDTRKISELSLEQAHD